MELFIDMETIPCRGISFARISHDGKMLLAKYPDGIMMLKKYRRNWKNIWSKPIPTTTDFTLTISPDGKYFTSTSYNYNIGIYLCETGVSVHVFRGHNGTIADICWSPCSTRLVTSDKDNVRVWNIEKGSLEFSKESDSSSLAVTYSPDGKYIAHGGISGGAGIYIWDVTDWKLVKKLTTHDTIWCIRWSPDGKHMIAGGSGTTFVWNTEEWREIISYSYETSKIEWVSCFEYMIYKVHTYGQTDIMNLYSSDPIETLRPPEECSTTLSSSKIVNTFKGKIVNTFKGKIVIYEPVVMNLSLILCGIIKKDRLSDPRIWYKIRRYLMK